MPRRLLDRCQPDSIREFRAAARCRFDDALSLAAAGRRMAAVYLWGYSAEMTLKAAYFSVEGRPETQPLTWGADLQPAIRRGQAMGIAWHGQGAGHNVRAWAELLVRTRALSPATSLPAPFGLEVQRRGQQVGRLWREFLRYHKNNAYEYEMRQIREAVSWLLVHARQL